MIALVEIYEWALDHLLLCSVVMVAVVCATMFMKIAAFRAKD